MISCMSMFLPLSTSILFVSLMQLVNGTEFLNNTFFSLLFRAVAVLVFSTIAVPLTSTHIHGYNYIKFNLTLYS